MDDAQQRQRFCEEIDSDFSVIAPAGVGKTFSIVERIYSIAHRCPQKLRALCVITYTKKAAEELKYRISERLRQHSNVAQEYLAQSFFGTIHSLCWQHIRRFDSDTYALLPDDRILREQFIADYSVNDEPIKEILRFVDLNKLLDLTEEFPPNEAEHLYTNVPPFIPNLQPIYDYTPEGKNRDTIPQVQNRMKAWEADYKSGKVVNIPTCSKGGEGFKTVFYETLQPFFDYLGEIAIAFIKKLAQDYFEYRIQHGFLKHSDMIFLAERCLNTEKAKVFFAKNPQILLLDEAQDTDEHQFRYIQKLYALNPQNRFSMVGDPQQSIYSRTDVQSYLELHQRLISEGKCEALVFSNTFRCPEAIVQVLNQKFPHVLNKLKDAKQVNYVPLSSAAKTAGSCETVMIPPMSDGETEAIAYEARYIARFLENYLQKNPRPLSDICFLVPRKDWLESLKQELSLLGWPLQIYSNKATYRDNPLFCAVLAFVHLINFPEDGFELAGILHGIFNISETDITLFDQPLQIAYPCEESSSPIVAVLKQLLCLRKAVVSLSPWTGISDVIRFFKPLCPTCDSDRCCEDFILEITFQIQSSESTWCALEFRLRNYLTIAIENEQMPRVDALQGFSCHKAKGLEWPTVILPFFYRPIRYQANKYPFLLNDKIVWHKKDKALEELFYARKRELQRLLYVTCTRAKQHLVILDDKALWKLEVAHPSFAELYADE